MRLTAQMLMGLAIVSPISSSYAATNNDWILIASTDAMKWEGRAGSWNLSKTNSGKDVSVANGRSMDMKTRAITFERWYVPVSDCRSGSGKVSTTDMAGNFKYDNEFVLKGGSIASSIADMLCSFVLENDGKGLS
jgi:hypothetical protein